MKKEILDEILTDSLLLQIRRYSNALYGVSWKDELEYVLYAIIHEKYDTGLVETAYSKKCLKYIKEITSYLETWVIYTFDGPELIPLSEFLPQYEKWKSANVKKIKKRKVTKKAITKKETTKKKRKKTTQMPSLLK